MSDNEHFFQERRALAVLKHGILRRYAPVFAGKTGSGGRRVVLLDGYAGPGRYDDGSPGSPLLLARTAQNLAALRDITGVYVERNETDYQTLRQVMIDAGRSTDHVLCGDVRHLLPQILDLAQDAALFAFLDPFGTALDRDQLVTGLLGRPGGQPVEVFLHVSVSTVARLGGLLRRRRAQGVQVLDSADAKAIGHLDRFLGGTWWQKYFVPVQEGDRTSATHAALQVTDSFRKSVCRAADYRAVSMPVRRRPGQLPKYVLVLFTKHDDGLWRFADCLGAAGREWEGAWRHELASDQLRREQRRSRATGQTFIDVFAPQPFSPEIYERENRQQWEAAIQTNLCRLLAARGPFFLARQVDEVYDDLLGAAGERHVRAAVKALHRARIVSNNGVGPYFYRQPIRPWSAH